MDNPGEGVKKSWYRTWFDSPYYHQLYSNHDETEAHHFIEALLNFLQPMPDARILDLACGRGRYSRFLAEKGFWVTGIDLSTRSIEEARPHEWDRLSFFQHDMRLPFRINYFDYIFNFFTSFGYFEKVSEDVKVLRNVQAGLNPKGRFVLDFFNANYVESSLLGRETKVREGIEFHLHKYVEGGYVFKDIRFRTPQGEHRFRERVRLYRETDFRRLFGEAGLEIVSTFGDYQLNPYRPEQSPRLILLARKAA